MKKLQRTSVCLCLISLFALAVVATNQGCTPQQLNAADQAIGGTPLMTVTPPTTQPSTTEPSTQPASVTLTSSPTPSSAQLTIHLVQDAAAAAAPVASAVVPQPWGGIVTASLIALSAVLGIFTVKQTSAANTANAVIAAAGPAVSQIVRQVTDNQTLATDVTSVAQIAPGIISLLTHPAATAAINATS